MLRASILFLALMSTVRAEALPEAQLFERYCYGCHGMDKKTARRG